MRDDESIRDDEIFGDEIESWKSLPVTKWVIQRYEDRLQELRENYIRTDDELFRIAKGKEMMLISVIDDLKRLRIEKEK
jgi:hypothetical protein